ncbi:ABC transporter ATP-binding protein [Paenibacillus sp. CCS19]|uniref:ABC transporter ATP-binding protein n=1 Tax=Paenibacillus sp. CCS19 TaxID=3158387 RepID=UPI002561DAF4|nr:ABC transporter ATP-binding protein [Paenibacillus cellulosilyticus]GMK37293.1 ABC transporter ATP-binding protein [Paenibacillus cellulosilyticus]
MTSPLLAIDRLSVGFRTDGGEMTAVDDLTLTASEGETICIVGESGSGKSVASQSILRLLGKNGFIQQGEIRLKGDNLLRKSEKELRRIRGKDIAIIFQEPMTALNPVFTVGHQLLEVIKLHSKRRGRDAREYAVELLRRVGIPRPESVMHDYPHALSGGMRQRVVIAMAIASKPQLLIADEPTTALDVTVQAQILALLKTLQEESGTSILLITHDLGVVAEMADKVVVMYAGQIVEQADVDSLFDQPMHPYTQGLMKAIPSVHSHDGERPDRLASIAGTVPALNRLPQGCRFHPRCAYATEICRQTPPSLAPAGDNRLVRCWLADTSGNSKLEPAGGASV